MGTMQREQHLEPSPLRGVPCRMKYNVMKEDKCLTKVYVKLTV